MPSIISGGLAGQYVGNWTTAVIAAALALDAPIAAMRNGPTQALPTTPIANVMTNQRVCWVTKLTLQLSVTAAFTAVQQFNFYLGRFSAANMGGGATVNPSKLYSSALIESVAKPGGAAAGDLRASTTAALTTAGVTLDWTTTLEKPVVYSWSVVGPADLPTLVHDFRENPIRLGVGEGLALVNGVVWPAAGTAILSGRIDWEERTII